MLHIFLLRLNFKTQPNSLPVKRSIKIKQFMKSINGEHKHSSDQRDKLWTWVWTLTNLESAVLTRHVNGLKSIVLFRWFFFNFIFWCIERSLIEFLYPNIVYCFFPPSNTTPLLCDQYNVNNKTYFKDLKYPGDASYKLDKNTQKSGCFFQNNIATWKSDTTIIMRFPFYVQIHFMFFILAQKADTRMYLNANKQINDFNTFLSSTMVALTRRDEFKYVCVGIISLWWMYTASIWCTYI